LLKKLLIIFIFLLIATGAVDEFYGSGEFGYCGESEDFYTLLELGYRIHLKPVVFTVYGGIEVFMDRSTAIFFNPYRDIYTAGGILQYRFLYLTIEHKCLHSVHSSDQHFEEKFIRPDSRTRFGIGFEF
jgi:hypothetical protein